MSRKKKAKKARTIVGRSKKTVPKTTKKAGRKATSSSVSKKKVVLQGKPRGARRGSRRTESQILGILREAESKGSNADIIRKHNLSPATFYAWKRKFS